MTIAELLSECLLARQQHLSHFVLRINRHGGSRMQLLKGIAGVGLIGSVIGSDKTGSYVAISIAKAEAVAAKLDPSTEIPGASPHRAKITPSW